MKIRIDDFKGTAPRIASHLLPNDVAQIAKNTRLTSGALRALNTPTISNAPIIAGAKSIYSIGPSGSSIVLSWATDTDVARSPVTDSEYRVYYTNGVKPKKTSYALGTAGVGPYPSTGTEYNMGVPAPTAAMTAAAAAGTNLPAPNTWVYVYTYITKFGTALAEESAPSPSVSITTVTGANQAVTLSGIADPAITAGYNYIGKRIYRTNGTAFVLVNATLVSGVYVSIPIGTTTYTDNVAANLIPGDPLPSVGWLPPPDDLQGLVSLPSGTMAGFRNNEIWFSEPGFPHAWPVKYMQTTDAPIVALKAFGNNLAVATQGNPYVGSGVYPDSFTFQKIARYEPCVSKRSMAGDEFGAVYASQNGLVSLGLDGDSLATSSLYTRQEFSALAPSTILGAVFEGRYYGFYSVGTNTSGLVFAKGDPTGVYTIELGATAVTIEPVTGQLLYINYIDGKLYTFDPVGTVPLTYTWKSKLFLAPSPVNFGCMQVIRRDDSATDIANANAVAAANAVISAANTAIFATGSLYSALNEYSALNSLALNDSSLKPLQPSVAPTITVYVYAQNELKYSREMQVNTVYKLPSGFKSLGWELMIIGQREIAAIEMATSIAELKAS